MVADLDFQVSALNSYRLVRTVEMYQWKEIETEEDEGEHGKKKKVFTYEKGWFSHQIESTFFHDQTKQNPINFWPFKNKTINAQNITLGDFRLNQSQIANLGHKKENYHWYDQGQLAI